MTLHHLSQERLAGDLGVVQGTIGHWLRGRNKINLEDFWRLCAAAGADPKFILFGPEDKTLATSIKQVLSAHPELIPGYPKYEKALRRSKRRSRTTS